MHRFMLIAATLVAPANAAANAAATDHDRIAAAANAAFAEAITEQPLLLLRAGKAARRLPDPSPAARAAFAARADAIVAPLAGIDMAKQPLAEAVLLEKLHWFTDRAHADAALVDYVFPIGGYAAPVLSAFDVFAQYPLDTVAQRDDYLALLADAARLIDTMAPRLQAQAARGIAVPTTCLAADRLKAMTAADAKAFAAAATHIVATGIRPAAQRFIAFARGPFAATASARALLPTPSASPDDALTATRAILRCRRFISATVRSRSAARCISASPDEFSAGSTRTGSMTNVLVLKTMIALSAFSIAGVALAGPVCTTEPKAKWLTEVQMKAKVAELGYKSIKTFQVSGSCYEIYGLNKDGKRAEVYFNPVTGAVVKANID